jgi:hypothetical protein
MNQEHFLKDKNIKEKFRCDVLSEASTQNGDFFFRNNTRQIKAEVI